MSRPVVYVADRYTALGIERPTPETVCLGQCEGTGFVPLTRPGAAALGARWLAALSVIACAWGRS